MKLTTEEAEVVWTILVEFAGAQDAEEGEIWSMKSDFIQYVTTEHSYHEFRFMGRLGAGGKFYIEPYGQKWRVGAYLDDFHRPGTREIVEKTNAALTGARRVFERLRNATPA